MFIDLNTLITKYDLKIKGVLHVGACLLEEIDTYTNNGIKNVVWIEGNSNLIEEGKKIIENKKVNHTLLDYLVYDQDDIELDFYITNNTQSSSVLQFGKHKQYYSYIDFVETVKKKAYTLKTIIEKNNINVNNYNMLNLDLQGVELRALKSLGEYINNIDYIYTEINNDSIYINNDLLQDIDMFLQKYGFKRAETALLNENWGDAFYIKIK